MIRGTDFCRAMRPGEEAAVADLLVAAFGGEEEARLVEALRKDRAIAGEMVMPGEDGAIVGYYALSAFARPKGWLCLAPVAIHPALQRQNRGKRMVGQLCSWAQATGQHVIVLGQPEFYEKCGFSLERAARLTSPYPISHTMLAGPGEGIPVETLVYPKAFGNP